MDIQVGKGQRSQKDQRGYHSGDGFEKILEEMFGGKRI